MSLRAEAAMWLAALGLAGAGGATVVHLLGVAAGNEAILLAAATALAAVAAHLAAGLAQRPVLALSLPLLVGWWAAMLAPSDFAAALLLAGGGGGLVGAGIGLVAAAGPARTAALTLAAAVAGDAIVAAFAVNPIPAAPAPSAAWLVAGLALVALAAGWWAQAGLAAALLHHGRSAEAAASLGLRPRCWLAGLGAAGGVAGGWAGAAMAQTAAGPPTVATGLALTVAALAGRGTMAVTFALTVVLWLLPQLALRVRPDVPELTPWLAALTVLVLGVAAGRGRDDAARDG